MKAAPLSPDWKPSEAVIEAGILFGLRRSYIVDIARAKFKRHHLDKRTLSTDFDDMFLTWLKEDAAKLRCKPGDATKTEDDGFVEGDTPKWHAVARYLKAQDKPMPEARRLKHGFGWYFDADLVAAALAVEAEPMKQAA